MIYFVSDVHLGYADRKSDRLREKYFIDFLKKIEADCTTLFVVGDLFDYWFEYTTVIPKVYVRTLAQLASMKEKGIDIKYIMGNHDFGHKSFFEEELNIPVITTDFEITISEKKFYIAHGDGKAHKDKGYLILRRILRNKISLKLFGWLHPDFGIKIALSSSRKSRKHTKQKDYGKSDGMRDFAEKKLNEGFDYVVMGHRHIAEKAILGSGYYVNLGEWLKTPTFGRFDGKEFTVEPVDKFLKETL